MSIKSIKLVGFKQFENYTVSCRNSNILVGPNNAGKSSILDAIRICSDVLRYAKSNKPKNVPQGDNGFCATFQIEHSRLSISLENVAYNYRDEPAEIMIRHENGTELHVRISPELPVVAFLKTEGRVPTTKAAFADAFPMDIVIVPTLGPFEKEEKYFTDETVNKNENTRLAHRNFRNILYRKTDQDFETLKSLLSETWPEISIQKPERYGNPSYIRMFYEEARMPREIHWSGFGFQIWMQILLQIMRGTEQSILVLDEPDIYLHADLQRKLLKLVTEKFGQLFIATHSTEIINESNPGAILSISKNTASASRVTSEENYRKLFSYLGSSENAEFARLSRANRVVFFEGKDRKLLRGFVSKVSHAEILDNTDTLYLQAGGFGQWRRVVDVEWTLENVFSIEAKIVALFDRDYRSQDQIHDFLGKINSERVLCKVLDRKEIENYALVEAPLVRTIRNRLRVRGHELSDDQVLELIDIILEEMKISVQAQIQTNEMSSRKRGNPKLDDASITVELIKKFDTMWRDRDIRLRLVSGKEFIAALSAVCQRDYQTTITFNHIVSSMRVGEVPEDLVLIIREFEDFLS